MKHTAVDGSQLVICSMQELDQPAKLGVHIVPRCFHDPLQVGDAGVYFLETPQGVVKAPHSLLLVDVRLFSSLIQSFLEELGIVLHSGQVFQELLVVQLALLFVAQHHRTGGIQFLADDAGHASEFLLTGRNEGLLECQLLEVFCQEVLHALLRAPEPLLLLHQDFLARGHGLQGLVCQGTHFLLLLFQLRHGFHLSIGAPNQLVDGHFSLGIELLLSYVVADRPGSIADKMVCVPSVLVHALCALTQGHFVCTGICQSSFDSRLTVEQAHAQFSKLLFAEFRTRCL